MLLESYMYMETSASLVLPLQVTSMKIPVAWPYAQMLLLEIHP